MATDQPVFPQPTLREIDPRATEISGGHFALFDLYRANIQSGAGAVIEGRTFSDCLIEGPAVMAVMTGTVFENCAMGTTTDVRNLLYRPVGQTRMAGVVGMANCRFVRCRFVQVGFTGSDQLIDELTAGIKPLSQAGLEPSA